MATKRILPAEVVAAYETHGHLYSPYPNNVSELFQMVLKHRGSSSWFRGSLRRRLGLSYWYGEGFGAAFVNMPRVFREYEEYCLGHADGLAAKFTLDKLHMGVTGDEAAKPRND